MENCRTAYASFIKVKDEIGLSNKHYINGLRNINKNTEMLGRFQIIDDEPFTILDSAHNEAGLSALFKQLKNPKGQLHVLFGCVSDKDIGSLLPLFPKSAHYYLCPPSVQRAMSIDTLKNEFRDFKVEVADSSFENVWNVVKTKAGKEDTILVCGSIFLIADCLNFVEKSQKA